MPEHWRNWSGDLHSTPARILAPASEDEVLKIVREAARAGGTVRVVGAGHSSMPLVNADGATLLSLERMQGIMSSSTDPPEAWVHGGTRIWALGDPLLERGLAMTTMGDIDRQSISGAIGTATHGTGRDLQNISAPVTALRLVTGEGELRQLDADHDPDLLRAARVAMGSMGIITAVRLRLVPAFHLHKKVWREPHDACIERIDERIQANRHFEFFWFPGTDEAEIKTLNPVARDAVPDAPFVPAGTTSPSHGPHEPVEGERSGWSAHIIPSVRESRFHEMEYAIPAEAGQECFARVRERMRTHHPDVAWPIEYRTVAADDAYLSPHEGRASVTISVHQDARRDYHAFFEDIEPIFWDYSGRPHWGKRNTLDADALQSRYPYWDAFTRARNDLDPGGVFLNPYLASLFA